MYDGQQNRKQISAIRIAMERRLIFHNILNFLLGTDRILLLDKIFLQESDFLHGERLQIKFHITTCIIHGVNKLSQFFLGKIFQFHSHLFTLG